MLNGKICDFRMSVICVVSIIVQFIDPRPRTPSGPFIGILLPTQGPVQACSSMGPCVTDSRPSWGYSSMDLCITDSRPLGVFGRRVFLEPNHMLVSRRPGEGLDLFLELHCSSLLGFGNEALSVDI